MPIWVLNFRSALAPSMNLLRLEPCETNKRVGGSCLGSMNRWKLSQEDQDLELAKLACVYNFSFCSSNSSISLNNG